jgi:hypothetical protein
MSMKKLYFLLSVITIPFALKSQSYIPMLDSVNLWQYNTSMLPIAPPPGPQTASACSYGNWYSNSKKQYTTHDTIIDSLTYKIVREETDLNPTSCDFGYVREDTTAHKVWFRDNAGNPEILLYDFSMQVSDTISLTFIVNGGLYVNGIYTVDSIVPFQIRNTVSRMFCLTNHNVAWGPTLYWVEGVGCLMNAFYLHSLNSSSGIPIFWQCQYYPQNSYEYMTCFDHLTKVYFDSCKYTAAMNDVCFMVTDSCNYYNICGNIDENTLNVEMNIFPAPATDVINFKIDAPNTMNLNITITDAFGRVVSAADQTRITGNVTTVIEQDISNLSAGTYYVILNSEGKT